MTILPAYSSIKRSSFELYSAEFAKLLQKSVELDKHQNRLLAAEVKMQLLFQILNHSHPKFGSVNRIYQIDPLMA